MFLNVHLKKKNEEVILLKDSRANKQVTWRLWDFRKMILKESAHMLTRFNHLNKLRKWGFCLWLWLLGRQGDDTGKGKKLKGPDAAGNKIIVNRSPQPSFSFFLYFFFLLSSFWLEEKKRKNEKRITASSLCPHLYVEMIFLNSIPTFLSNTL